MLNRNIKFHEIILVILFSVVFAGCVQGPKYRAWRPWIRTSGSLADIQPNSKIKVVVEGKTEPLMGNEKFLRKQIIDFISEGLKRKGFSVVQKNADFYYIVNYKTTRDDKLSSDLRSVTKNYSSNIFGLFTAAGSGIGTGIMAASAIGGGFQENYSGSETAVSMNMDMNKNYIHTISLEILNRNENLIWKADSTWDSSNINISSEIKIPLMMLMSDLPSSNEIPRVKKVAKDKVVNFSELKCRGKRFTNPAVPYNIRFNYYSGQSHQRLPRYSEVDQPQALAAYLDLVQTAEIAVPFGYSKYYKKEDLVYPLEKDLWKVVILSRKYFIGNDKEPYNVMIKLKWDIKGYKIERCWLAKDKEFKEYKSKLKEWRQVLKDYFDIYE